MGGYSGILAPDTVTGDQIQRLAGGTQWSARMHHQRAATAAAVHRFFGLAGPVDWLNGLIHGLGGRWLAQQLWTIDGLGGPVDGLIKLVEGLFLFFFLFD